MVATFTRPQRQFKKTKKMKEIKDFIEKLKEERNSLNQKCAFVHQHKFEKEADFLSTKIDVINKILYELESVVNGKQKGINSKFEF